MKTPILLVSCVVLLCAGASQAVAQGTTFSHQGQLTDSGAPANGAYDLRFAVYDAESGGNQIGPALTNAPVGVSNGVFTVYLDFGGGVFTGPARWLEMGVRTNGSTAAYNTFARELLAATPYAITAGDVTSPNIARLDGLNTFSSTVNFSPASGPPFNVSSSAKVSNLNADFLDGLDSTAFATNGHNHFGETWVGSSYGQAGLAINNTNTDENVFAFYATTPVSGAGVGIVGNGGLYGVVGYAPNGFAGVSGTCTSFSGVKGTSSTGNGVYGTTSSSAWDGAGVYGFSTLRTGAGNSGVSGYGDYGVKGETYDNIGVYAHNGISGKTAYLATGGLAADLYGDVYVHGDFSATGLKSFLIDHPLDPANKYLRHACVESSDVKNIYDGVALLDAQGEATVSLPPWFEALNRDFRYQLTAVGAPGPNLHIAKEVSGNQFKIGGGTANMKVSWQITGIRNDAWAKAHPFVAEEQKPAGESGSFLAPEEHGQPKDRSMQWARHPESRQAPNQPATPHTFRPPACLEGPAQPSGKAGGGQ